MTRSERDEAAPGVEADVRALARRLAALERRTPMAALHPQWWSDQLLASSMEDPEFRSHLFRFVDTFPALRRSGDVVDHFDSEFAGVAQPRWMAAGRSLTGRLPGGARVVAAVARRGIAQMAHQFIVGSEAAAVGRAVGVMRQGHTGAIVDLLGEHTHSEAEGDRYADRLFELVRVLADEADHWAPDDRLDHDDIGPLPRVGVSIKVSALAPSFHPLTSAAGLEQAQRRLLPILEFCADRGVYCWFDLERYETKSLTHLLFRRLLDEPGLGGLHAGIVLQAYLRDAAPDLEALADWARGRALPVGVRLVKGAYWDTETIESSAKGWPSPVFSRKADTDANYERLACALLDRHGVLRPAFASHNLRSLARAIVEARRRDIPDNGYEIQLLYGMAEPVHEAIRSLGLRLRVYAPMGDLVPGMAYLVRRLLENTANESFVRTHYAKGAELEALFSAPVPLDLDGAIGTGGVGVAVGGDVAGDRVGTVPGPTPYEPEPEAQWHRPEVDAAYGLAIEAEFVRGPRTIRAVIDGRPFPVELESMVVGDWLESIDPADPTSVVAHSYAANLDDANAAVHGAVRAGRQWRRTAVEQRAAVLFGAAAELRPRRPELAALEVHEAGKPWAEADADVCEAIDFCEYYGREMLRLSEGGLVQSPAGEANRLTYRARGVCAVIAPWNFPLAIATGMTTAALVTGNAVILKPAEQTPAIAYELVRALEAAGLPQGVCQFLPGRGEVVGAALAAHPDIDTIAFTGSRAVGLQIMEVASKAGPGRHSIPRTILELGGKNAIIVCADADLDEVVPAVITSAFSFSGQKCSALSRLICVGDVYDKVIERVSEAARVLQVGPPRQRGTQVGPVIDEEAHTRLLAALGTLGRSGAAAGSVVFSHAECPTEGFYVPPTIVGEVDPTSSLARDELFGPVLACFRVVDLNAALALANDGDYALTAGVFSRSPSDIAHLVGELEAGNLYVNRGITGAVVGRQPFGGRRLSGGGTKAGGPDYLLSFCDPIAVSENTLRQGFAPT